MRSRRAWASLFVYPNQLIDDVFIFFWNLIDHLGWLPRLNMKTTTERSLSNPGVTWRLLERFHGLVSLNLVFGEVYEGWAWHACDLEFAWRRSNHWLIGVQLCSSLIGCWLLTLKFTSLVVSYGKATVAILILCTWWSCHSQPRGFADSGIDILSESRPEPFMGSLSILAAP